jgi:ABC-type taurine transport system substrate-binding protein
MMATLASGGVPLVWAAPGSAISTSVGGMKLTCFAVGNNTMPRELVVRKGIDTPEDLRGKSFGVQSIGGGFWLSTMVALEGLGLDPDKYKLNRAFMVQSLFTFWLRVPHAELSAAHKLS